MDSTCTRTHTGPLTRRSGSPWGAIQDLRQQAPGIQRVSTASHGGLYLTAALWDDLSTRFPTISPYAGPQWFEEDADWALVVLAFPSAFSTQDIADAVHVVQWHTDVPDDVPGIRIPSHWADMDTWLRSAPVGAELLAIAATVDAEHARHWEVGSCGCGARHPGWSVSLHRGHERRHVLMPDYPEQRFYTDSELTAYPQP